MEVPDAAAAERAALLLSRLRFEMAGPRYHGFLRPVAEAVDAETGEVCIRIAYRPEFSGSAMLDFYHGGVLASLIDLAGHAAVAVQIGRTAPTIDLRIDYLKPAGPIALIVTAKVLRLGRSIARADVEVRDAENVLVATGRGTFSTAQTSS